MRHFILATHGHFSAGIREGLELVFGKQDTIETISAFVDGANDIQALVADALARQPADCDVVVCTDILGGSVNNEFLKTLPTHPRVHLVAGMNLPMLILMFMSPEPDTATMIRQVLSSSDIVPHYCNDEFQAAEGSDEDF